MLELRRHRHVRRDDDDDESIGYVRPLLQLKTVNVGVGFTLWGWAITVMTYDLAIL